MFPHVEHQQRRCPLAHVALVVVDLLDDQPLAERFPRECTPPGPLDVERRLSQLVAEMVEAAETVVDGGAELTLGRAATVG